jgi:hypothetical protein
MQLSEARYSTFITPVSVNLESLMSTLLFYRVGSINPLCSTGAHRMDGLMGVLIVNSSN